MPDVSATLARLRAVAAAAAQDGVRAAGAAAKVAPASATPPSGPTMNSSAARAPDEIVTRAVANAPPAPRDHRMLLLYNGACSVCRAIAAWIIEQDDAAHGGRQAIDERPIGHDPQAIKALDPRLDIMEAYEHVHVILPDGTIKKDGEAVSEVLKRLPETSWIRFLLRIELGGWRPMQSLVDLGFATLSELRSALGCTACNQPVPWWGKPVEWLVKAYKALSGSADPGAEAPVSAKPLGS